MQWQNFLVIARQVPEKTAKQARKWTPVAMFYAILIVGGYALLWWGAVLLTTIFGSNIAAGSFIGMGIFCLLILTPIITGVGLADLAENFLPFDKKDIPTGEIASKLALPLLASLPIFLFAWLFGVESSGQFLQIAGINFLLCVVVGINGLTPAAATKKTGGK